MSSSQYRCVVLIALLAAASSLMAGIDGTRPTRTARWPTNNQVYLVHRWTVSSVTTEAPYGIPLVVRSYSRPGGLRASLVISTSPEAKHIYRAGAEVPFLGSGYEVNPAPPSLVKPRPERSARLIRRDNEVRLLIYTYGERRGLLGNGPLAWTMVALDAALGRSNDYYLARIVAPLDNLDQEAVAQVVELADALFPRVAAWYAD